LQKGGKITPNRVIAVLTPVIFAPLAGYIAAWVAKHLPGVEVQPEDLTPIFVAGALSVLAPMWKWLDGWQKYEQREAEITAELGRESTLDLVDREFTASDFDAEPDDA